MHSCAFNIYLGLVCVYMVVLVRSEGCHQARSRIVRGVLQHHLRQLYKNDFSKTVPRSCPFHNDRDIFMNHESHKSEESYGKWYCGYCGKSFYAEVYLDNHLQARHAQYLYNAPDAVCLADYCDIFRCDVVSGRTEATFWDTALCIEDDMEDMVQKCSKVFQTCLPQNISSMEYSVMNKTRNTVCSSLSCNRFWYTGKVEENQWLMLLKTFCTVFLIGSLVIYYFLAYQHFYSEPLFSEREMSPPPMKPFNRPLRQTSHQRRRKRRVMVTL